MIDPRSGDRLSYNQRRVVALIARMGEVSRTEVARQLDLPKATVAGVVADLIGRGQLVEAVPSDRPAAPGRPAQVVALAGPPTAIGVLTWSEGSLQIDVVTLGGLVVSTRTSPVESVAPSKQARDAASELLETAAAAAGYNASDLAALVMSLPAPLQRVARPAGDASAARRWDWLPAWLDEPLARDLAAHAGIAAYVENDANLGALGEHAFGAGRGKQDQVYIKIGERGVGSGLIFGGRLHRGATGLAGELAHVQVRDDGPLCGCGGRGCLLRTISIDTIDLAQPAYDQTLNFATMLRLANAGDIGLQRLLTDVGRGIGRPLADLCTMLNPDLFVLDGSIGAAGDHIIAGIAEAIDRHARPAASAAASVVNGALGAQAEVLGAVALVRHEMEVGNLPVRVGATSDGFARNLSVSMPGRDAMSR